MTEDAQILLEDDGVAVVFGCWTSVSRKSVLPVFEELNGLLFYPVQYEGEECSNNIFYTGAAPNQQAIPAVQYLMSRGFSRWVLLGTDYVYPRTTNTILRAFLNDMGYTNDNILEIYTPFSYTDWDPVVSEIQLFQQDGISQGKSTAIISTINGDANTSFYEELAGTGVDANTLPVIAFSVGEAELAGLNATNLVGHLAAWNYFMSINNSLNHDFIDAFQAYIRLISLCFRINYL